MGFMLKSAIGLGAVYVAMFGQAIKPADVRPSASLCTGTVGARIAGDASLRARWSEAGCALRLAAAMQPVIAPPPKAAPPEPPPMPPTSRARALGTLSDADLAEPWFGPGKLARKTARRG